MFFYDVFFILKINHMHKQKKEVRKAKEHENVDTLSYKFYLGQADMTVIVE